MSTRRERKKRSKVPTKDPRVLFLYLLLRDAVPMGEMERILGIIEESYVQGATEFHFSDVHLAGRARHCESRLEALEECQTMEIVP